MPAAAAAERGGGRCGGARSLVREQHQVIGHHVGHVQVHDPVHEVEAHEANREHDARVLVDVRRRYPQVLAEILQQRTL